MSPISSVLVTGATGFVGAHVVDELLRRGIKVKGTTRSPWKANKMLLDRPDHKDHLEFLVIGDLATEGVFDRAVEGVDAIIHTASPVTFDITDNEREMLIPAIEGTKSILSSAKSQPTVKRVVLTSSIASVMDFDRHNEIGLTFTSADWNPVTYEQAKVSNPVVAYNGAKKYAELAAWDFIKNEGPQFDLVTICPPMVFGPMVHPVSKLSEINGSTGLIWQVASGTDPWPTAPLTAWVDVRDLAVAHVEALLRPDAGNQRFVISSPQKFTYQRIADILRQEFAWAREEVTKGDEGAPIPRGSSVDGETAAKVLGIGYRGFKECMLETVPQLKKLQGKDNLYVTI